MRTDPRQEAWIEAVDAAIGEQVAGDPAPTGVQALEATWRGVRDLVANLDSDLLRVDLLDVTKQELLADLRTAAGQPRATSLYTLLIDREVQLPDSQPWSLLVGDYAFGATPDDIALLAALGSVAAHASGPFLAAADPNALGCASAAELAGTHAMDAAARHRRTALAGTAPDRGRALAGDWRCLGCCCGCPTARKPNRSSNWSSKCRWAAIPTPIYGQSGLRLRAADRGGVRGERLGFQPRRRAGTGRSASACVWRNRGTADAAGHRSSAGRTSHASAVGTGIMPLLGHRQRNVVRLARFQSWPIPGGAGEDGGNNSNSAR